MPDPIIRITRPYSQPEWRAACENLPLTALGLLAWLYYAAENFPDQDPVSLDELDPNLELGVEDALTLLAEAGYVTLEQRP